MEQNLLQKLQKILLSLVIILVPFIWLPQKFYFSSIGPNAVSYVLLISLIFFVCECYKYKLKINKTVLYFFIVYVSFQIISLLQGLIIYPYYDLIDISQLTKLQYLSDKFNMPFNNNIIISMWLFIRESKNIILSSFYFCFIPLLFLHLFSYDYKKAFSFMEKAVLVLICLFCIYSVPEIIYLKFNSQFAKNILETINPFLYDVSSAHGWWPPLLWDYNGGQLRSLCPEPSFFGIISAFCIPFLLNTIYKNFSFKYIFLFFLFIFMLFMSKSRTSMVLFLIEIFILISFLLYNFSKKNLVFVVFLLFTISFSMILNLSIPNKLTQENKKENLVSYIDDNLVSTVKTNIRTNNTRFANIIAMVKVGLSKPILGVGTHLKDAYMIENIPEFATKDDETKLWIRQLKKEGLKSNFPALNQYIYVFAENGIIGLIIFVFPIIYIIYIIYKNSFLLKNFDFMTIFIVFIGQLFAMLGHDYLITYPISLGLIYFYLNSYSKSKNEN